MSFQNRMPFVFYQKYFLKNCHIDFIFIQWQFIVATGCQVPKKNHYKKPLKLFPYITHAIVKSFEVDTIALCEEWLVIIQE